MAGNIPSFCTFSFSGFLPGLALITSCGYNLLLIAGCLLLLVVAFNFLLHHRVCERTLELSLKNRELEKSQAQLQLALETANEALWDWNIETDEMYLSSHWLAMLGYERGDIPPTGQAVMNLVHPEDIDAVRRDLTETFSGHTGVFSCDFRLKKKNDLWQWVASRARVIERDAGERPLRMVGANLDIDQRKETETELDDAKKRAEAANVAKSSFLAHMSHELRTPLNAVIGLTSLLLRSKMNEEQHEYIETIQLSGETLLTIINDILDLSKVEAGELQLERKEFELRSCVESALDLVAPRAEEKQLELSYHIDPEVPGMVRGDIVRLRQVLLNLLNNAIKFTEQGEVTLTVWAEPHIDVGKSRIFFSVRDTGVGMSSEQVHHIFAPFKQADSSTTRRYGGTGLGLTISQNLVRLMQGNFDVQSRPGLGSTFTFYAEIVKVPTSKERHLEGSQPELKGKTALLVDDNETNRRILEQHLRFWGMESVLANSGPEALAKLDYEGPFDLALLDMFMPGMDGLDLVQIIKAKPALAKIPLIMLTSSMGHDAQLQDSELAAVLFKPVKPAALFQTMIQVMHHQKSDRRRSLALPEAELGVRKPLRILMVEDNLINQKVGVRLLQKLGYEADVTANGLEALGAFEAGWYDVVLMDVQMPKMDGLAATRALRDRFPREEGPYIIGISAHALPEERDRAMETGMDDYLAKPVRIDELRSVLIRVPEPSVNSAHDSLRDAVKNGSNFSS